MQTAEAMGLDAYELMNEEAKRVPIGSNRLLFLPYLMGERSPILDSNARGVFFGLSGMHKRPDMLRAVMEGVVFSQRSCMDVFKEMKVPFEEMIATGGGGGSALWRQMLADVLNCRVVTVDNAEGPALGAAIIAGVGVGLYPSISAACDAVIKKGEPQQPENTALYEPYYELYTELYSRLSEQFGKLAGLDIATNNPRYIH
jgi:xylulokinase